MNKKFTDVDANADAILESQDHDTNGIVDNNNDEKQQVNDEITDDSNLSERDRRIAEMVKDSNKRRDEELIANGYQAIDTSGDGDDEIETDHEEDEPSDNGVDNTEQTGVNSQRIFASDTVTLTVNGVQKQFTAEQAQALLQKELAGDAKLEEANRREQDLARREQEFNQRSQTTQPSPDVVKVDDANVNDLFEKAALALEDGNHKDYAKYNSQAQQLLIDNNARISNEDNLRRQQQQRFDDANTAEKKLLNSGQYDDIYKDPMAYQLAAIQVGELNKSGFNGTPEELMLKAIDNVRAFKGAGNKQDANRLDKKRASPSAVRSGASRTGSSNKPKQRELTEAERVRQQFDQARAARNQTL